MLRLLAKLKVLQSLKTKSNYDTLIIGAGKVGTATGISLKNQVDYHDPIKGMLVSNYTKYQYVIVCVDTLQQGPEDYQDIETVLEELENFEYVGTVVIRSTVSPHKIPEWDQKYSFTYLFFPEFMPQQDGRLIVDAAWTVVIGGDELPAKSFSKKLHSSGYPAKKSSYNLVTKEEACIIKLGNNAGLSSKLVYFNSIYKICEEFGASYEQVRTAIEMDARLGKGHSSVPSPDDGLLGFSGHCLPKDLKAISKLDSLGYFNLIETINNNLRKNSKNNGTTQ